jgi:hypothetical protein
MAFSDSTYFSDTNSYKILFISSYRLKDMIYARFAYLQEFFRKTEISSRLFSPRRIPSRSMTGGAVEADWTLTKHG